MTFLKYLPLSTLWVLLLSLPGISLYGNAQLAGIDLDETIVHRRQQIPYISSKLQQGWKALKVVWAAPNKGLLYQDIKQMFADKKKDPQFFKSLAHLESDEAIDALAQRYKIFNTEVSPGYSYAQYIKEEFSKGVAITPVQEILLELQKNGVDLAIATNVGTNVVKRLQADGTLDKRLDFKFLFTADCPTNPRNEKGYCIKKDSPQYFINFAQTAQKKGYEAPYLYIDDKQSIVDLASSINNGKTFEAIRYNGDAKKLRATLVQKGYLSPSCPNK